MIESIRKWNDELAPSQRLWIIGSTLAIMLLGIISGDS